MAETNPYQVPQSAVTDADDHEFGEVRAFSYKGRLGRLRYLGYSSGLYLVVGLVTGLLGVAFAAGESYAGMAGTMNVISVAVSLAIMPLMFMLTVQRLHDVNFSGWLSLLMLVPLLNLIVALALMLVPGTKGQNRFGLRPPPNSTGVVVVALILPSIFTLSILAAIAIPAYQSYVEEAKMQAEQQ